MTDQQQTELLNSVLHALLGDNLKGTFLVEVKLTTTIDADNITDAQEKGLQFAKEHPEQLRAYALKIEDLLHKER